MGAVNRAKRWIYVAFGVLLVGIGALGVILPGLPATIFLLGATWCFGRSCPWLEERLLRNRFFAPYMRIVDGTEPMTNRARVATIGIIWLAVSSSVAILQWRGVLSAWGLTALVLAALTGSVVVWRFRRPVSDG